MADDDKKRTQEASETNFTTRGGRQDETSGAGKPWTSPCKRRPETPADDADPDAETIVGPPLPALTDLGDSGPLTIERALQGIRPLTDCCSARDLLILSCLSTKTAACATPAVWRRLRDREWAALPADDPVALKKTIQTLTNRGVWRASEAPLAARPKSHDLRRWEAELVAEPVRRAARDAIDAARKALGEDQVRWWDAGKADRIHTGEGIHYHSSYSFAENRILDHYVDQDELLCCAKDGIDDWRLRATLGGRRLEDRPFCPDSDWGSATHVRWQMCATENRSGNRSRWNRFRWLDEPEWYVANLENKRSRRAAAAAAQEAFWDNYCRAEDAGEDVDSDAEFYDSALDHEEESDYMYDPDALDDSIWDAEQMAIALRDGNRAHYDEKLETLRGARLELDLVRVTDGAVIRLASGVADGGVNDVGFEVVWNEIVVAGDPFLRIYAELILNYEAPEDCGLHVRFYDSSVNWYSWDCADTVPFPVGQSQWAPVLAKAVAMYDVAKKAGVAVRVPRPATSAVVAWRESVYAFHLLARGGALAAVPARPTRLISDYTYGAVPPRRADRTALYRSLEYCAKGSDPATCLAPTWTWPQPDHGAVDASRYLFVAQVRGYWPSFAQLYGVREDASLNRWKANSKHHLEFRLEPRGLERETAYDFSEPPLARYFTIHVIRVDDGAIAELPLSLYYLLGGQWPTSSGYASLAQALANYPGPGGDETPRPPTRDPAEPAINPLCRAWLSFVNKGAPAVDGAEFNITEMCVMGKDTIDAVNKKVKEKTVDHDLLRINFKNVDMDSPCHVRLGPSAREALEAPGGRCNPLTKGGGVLAYIDALFWLAETTQKATR